MQDDIQSTGFMTNDTDMNDEDKVTGTIKWFSPQKGYGFISREGEDDLFVHITAFRRMGDEAIRPSQDQKVSFTVGQGPKGPCAENVVILD